MDVGSEMDGVTPIHGGLVVLARDAETLRGDGERKFAAFIKVVLGRRLYVCICVYMCVHVYKCVGLNERNFILLWLLGF